MLPVPISRPRNSVYWSFMHQCWNLKYQTACFTLEAVAAARTLAFTRITASYYIRLSVFSWPSLPNAHTSGCLHQKSRNNMQVQNIHTYLPTLSRPLLHPHSTHNFTNLHTGQLFSYSEILCNLFHTLCSASAAFWTSEWLRPPSHPLVESLACRARIITSPTATPAPAMTHRCLSSASSSTQQAASTEVKIHVGLLGFWKKGYEGHFHRCGWPPYDLSPRC
jgi:hypothetical protein